MGGVFYFVCPLGNKKHRDKLKQLFTPESMIAFEGHIIEEKYGITWKKSLIYQSKVLNIKEWSHILTNKLEVWVTVNLQVIFTGADSKMSQLPAQQMRIMCEITLQGPDSTPV